MEAFVEDSVEVASVKASITSAKASNTPMKASMESFVDTFEEAPDKVTSVKLFISFISFMEAFEEA